MGKPLISDAQMLAMHAAMVELRQASPRRSAAAAPAAWPIALLAATLLQVRSEDFLVNSAELPLAANTLRRAQQSSFHPELLPFRLACPPEMTAAVAVGYALAQSQLTRPGDHAPLTMAFLGTRPPEQEALRLAGAHLLPLLLVMRDEPGKPRIPLPTTANVEVVPVDAEDAVAVCRVMQESMLRARNRWGTVVLRGVTLPGSTDPIASLEAHLKRRHINPALSQGESR